MTKEQAYEKLELPVGADLQLVRQKFQQMHNDFQVQIDGAFNEAMRKRKEQQLDELKIAYAILNESASVDDSASLPRTEKTFDQTGEETKTQTTQQQSQANEQQQAPPPPPPREESQQPKEQATPVYTTPSAKNKSNRIFLLIAFVILLVIGAFYYFRRTSEDDKPSQSAISNTVDIDAIRDSATWQNVTETHNIVAYQNYLNKYSEGIFRDEAQKAIDEIQAENEQRITDENRKKIEEANVRAKDQNSERKNTPIQEIAPVYNTAEELNKLAAEISFEFESSVLTTQSYRALDQISKHIRDRGGNYNFIVHVYTGETEDYDMRLAQDQGNSLKTYLVHGGVEARLITVIAKGNSIYKWKTNRFLLEIKQK